MNRYKIIYQKNNKKNRIFIYSLNKEELIKDRNYPENVLKITEQKKLFALIKFYFQSFNKEQKVYDFFNQLKTIINADLNISESLKLINKNEKNILIKNIIQKIQYAINNNRKLSEVFKNDSSLDKTDILFLELGIQNGNIKDAVNSLVTVKKEIRDSKKRLIETLRYPLILIFTLIGALFLIFNFVLPNFEFIFSNIKTLPKSTRLLLDFREFILYKWEYLLLSSVFILFFIFILHKKFRFYLDKFLFFYGFWLKALFINYAYYKFFLSIYIIVKAKYKFQTALEHSKDIVDNLYIKNKIANIFIQINNGKTIPKAFERSNLFDDLTVQLLYSAEYSNSYEKILKDISVLYKKRFQESIKNFSLIIEPALILTISAIVLWIVLAVMVPVWDLSASL